MSTTNRIDGDCRHLLDELDRPVLQLVAERLVSYAAEELQSTLDREEFDAADVAQARLHLDTRLGLFDALAEGADQPILARPFEDVLEWKLGDIAMDLESLSGLGRIDVQGAIDAGEDLAYFARMLGQVRAVRHAATAFGGLI